MIVKANCLNSEKDKELEELIKAVNDDVYFPVSADLCLGYDRCCEEGGDEQGWGWPHGHRSTYNVCPCWQIRY